MSLHDAGRPPATSGRGIARDWVRDDFPDDIVHRILAVTQSADVASVVLETHSMAEGP